MRTLETLAQHKVELPDRFFFGAAKALLTLASENYVTDDEFAKKLRAQVEDIHTEKWLVSLVDYCRRGKKPRP